MRKTECLSVIRIRHTRKINSNQEIKYWSQLHNLLNWEVLLLRVKLNRNQVSVIYLYIILLFLLTVVFVPYGYKDISSPFEQHSSTATLLANEESFGNSSAVNIHIDYLRWSINLGGITVFFIPLFFIAGGKRKKIANWSFDRILDLSKSIEERVNKNTPAIKR